MPLRPCVSVSFAPITSIFSLPFQRQENTPYPQNREYRSERPRDTQENLVLNILRRPHNLQLLPKTRTNHTTESKEDTKRDAKTPDGFQLEAGRLGGAGPDPVVDFTHVLADGGEEGGGASAVVGESGAVEVGEWLADCDGYDDNGDQDGAVECGGD